MKNSIYLITFLSSLYLLTSGGHISMQDEVGVFLTSHSLLTKGSFSVPQMRDTRGSRMGVDGGFYTPFGPVLAIISVPFVSLGSLLGTVCNRAYFASMLLFLINPIITALTCLVLYKLGIREGLSERKSVLLGLCYGVGTLAFYYANTYFTEPLAALLTLYAVYRIELYNSDKQPTHLFISGCCTGLLPLVRISAGLMLPLIGIGILTVVPRTRECFKLVAQWLIPVILLLLVLGTFNYVRFGSFLETGYNLEPDGSPRWFTKSIWYGLRVFLVSPGKSIFISSPILLLCLFYLPRFFRTNGRIAVLSIAIALANLIFFSRWGRPEGGHCFGPRLLLPMHPFLLLPLISGLKDRLTRTGIIFILVAVLAGTTLQLLGLISNVPVIIAMNESLYYSTQYGGYNLAFNPYPLLWDALQHGMKNCLELWQPQTQQQDHYGQSLYVNWAEVPNLWYVHLLYSGCNRLSLLFIVIGLCVLLFMSGRGLLTINPRV